MYDELMDFEKRELALFNGIELTVERDADGNGWMSNPEVARGLGYKNVRHLTDLRNRHEDELFEGEHYIRRARSAEHGPGSDLVFWNLDGVLMLSMFARTEWAKEFRRWAKDVLKGVLTAQHGALGERVERGFQKVTRWAVDWQGTVSKQGELLAQLVTQQGELLTQQAKLMDHVLKSTQAPAEPTKEDEDIPASRWLARHNHPARYAQRLGLAATRIGARERWVYTKTAEEIEVAPGVWKRLNLRPDWQWQVTWDNTDFGDPVTRIS